MTLTRTLQSIALLAAATVAGLTASTVRAPAAEAAGPANAAPAGAPVPEPTFSPADLEHFEKNVRPVLVENCFKCHNDKKQKAGLRLDSRSLILKGGDHGPAIDLTNPDKSILLKAINYTDEDMEMPPSGKLEPAQIEAITKWVKAGAPWPAGDSVAATTPEHPEADAESLDPDKNRDRWEYTLPKRPPVPAVKDAAFVKTPIDVFILAKLQEKNLTPNGKADKVALIRRAYYDLLGLPPTPAEVDAFVADQSADAWPKLIDRLLASPQYGERWGRHWLDLVRYAETHGYERDNPKPFAWRYRDYVIKSFNDDKPYDQFLKEQLAGDELDQVTAESTIATGFYRLGVWDDEPADRPLARYDVLDGVVSTTTSVVLGMSVGCARCHDHKKDPILAKDYYAFLAFFNDVSDMNVKNTKLFVDEESRQIAEKQAADKAAREAAIYREAYGIEQDFLAAAQAVNVDLGHVEVGDLTELTYKFYRDTWKALPDFTNLKYEESGEISNGFVSLSPATRDEAIGLVFEGRLKVPADGKYTFHLRAAEGVRLTVDGKKVVDLPKKDQHAGDFTATLPAGLLPFKLEYFNSYAKPELALAWSGNGFAHRPLSKEGVSGADRVLVADARQASPQWLYTEVPPEGRWATPRFDTTSWKKGIGGFGAKNPPGGVVRTPWESREIWMRQEFQLESIPKNASLTVHHDEEIEVFFNGTRVFVEKGYLRQYKRVRLEDDALKALKKGMNVLAVYGRNAGSAQYMDVGLVEEGAGPGIGAVVAKDGPKLIGKDKSDRYAQLTKDLSASRQQKMPPVGVEIMAVQESSRGKPTHVLIRGNPGSEGELVQPAFPTVLMPKGASPPALPKASVSGESSGKRRVLAEWLASDENPRTARVMVNRIWQYHFGRGINYSPNEFGRLGEGVTHPELLDWLAAEFVEGGWTLKRMHRLIMTSSVYQMSAAANPAAIAADPANNLFWRFNMRRLGAEEVRDSMLAVTGKLNLEQYGPSVYPPIPPEVLAGQSRPGSGWGKATPEEAARRSVYVHVKRSLLVPILSSHDMADTDSSCPVRFTTTVPTQSLGMLNGSFSNEQAADLAERLRKESPDSLQDQVKRAIRLTTGRQPKEAEVKADVAFIEQLKQQDKLSDDEALRIYCLMTLNTNEFVYLD